MCLITYIVSPVIILLSLNAVTVESQHGYGDENSNVCGPLDLETRSALRRARGHCKEEIHRIACLTPKMFTQKLPHSCPKDNNTYWGKYVGCFLHRTGDHMLHWRTDDFDVSNSPETCIRFCYRVGAHLAGVHDSTACTCGSRVQLKEDRRLPDHMCQTFECPGDRKTSCGGKDFIAVYETGLHQLMLHNFTHLFDIKNRSNVEPARILYLLQVAGRGIRHLRRTLNLMYAPEHYYYIHVDERFDYLHREVLELEKLATNIRVKRNRFDSIWGGSSFMFLTLDSLRDMFEEEEFQDWNWDYATQIPESDMPLTPPSELALFLGKNKGRNFVDFFRFWGGEIHMQSEILLQAFYQCGNKMWRVAHRKIAPGVRIAGGVSYFTFSRDFLEYLSVSRDPLVRQLKVFFNYTVLPMEHFVHTAMLNSHFCTSANSEILRLNSFWMHREHPCRPNVDYCGGSPFILRHWDFQHVLDRSKSLPHLHFFARKFDPFVDQAVVHQVENQNLLLHIREERQRERMPGYFSYWVNDYHYLDRSPPTNAAKLALMGALANFALDNIQELNDDAIFSDPMRGFPRCIFDPRRRKVNISELTVARHEDRFTRYLVYYNVSCYVGEEPEEELPNQDSSSASRDRVTVVMESEFKKVHRPNIPLGSRLNNVAVGTDVDLVEKLFRNYLGGLSMADVPSVQHSWNASKQATHVRIVWIDPDGSVRDNSSIELVTAEHQTIMTQYNAGSRHPRPLEPAGIWKVELNELKTGEFMGGVEFAVFPGQGARETRKLHIWLGSGLLDEAILDREMMPYAFNESRKNRIHNRDPEKFRDCGTAKCGSEDGSVDQMARQFFQPTEHCFEDLQRERSERVCDNPQVYSVRSCQRSPWSSRSPDPKSDFNPNLRKHLTREELFHYVF